MFPRKNPFLTKIVYLFFLFFFLGRLSSIFLWRRKKIVFKNLGSLRIVSGRIRKSDVNFVENSYNFIRQKYFLNFIKLDLYDQKQIETIIEIDFNGIQDLTMVELIFSD